MHGSGDGALEQWRLHQMWQGTFFSRRRLAELEDQQFSVRLHNTLVGGDLDGPCVGEGGGATWQQ